MTLKNTSTLPHEEKGEKVLSHFAQLDAKTEQITHSSHPAEKPKKSSPTQPSLPIEAK